MVRDNAAAGADVIKVMASGGQMTPGGANMWEAQFSVEQLRVVVDEARVCGLPVAAHAHGADSIAAAVTAGVRTIEHCTWMIGAQQVGHREDVARQMSAAGIYACAALSRGWPGLVERMGPERAGKHFGRLPWMDSLGVRLITGTDAGLSGSGFDDFVGALGLYEWLGFSAAQIIQFATVNSAAALGLATTTGRVAAGLAADLVVVDGNPLTDLQALRAHRLIMVRGQIRRFQPSGPR